MISKNKYLGFYSYKYSWAPSITYLHRRFLFLSHINKFKNDTNILEIGSGSGSILATINDYFPKINTYAYEKSSKAINLINKFSSKTIIVKDFNEKNKYDSVIFFEVMEHVKDDNKFLDKVYNSLKKDGRIIFSVPAHAKKWSVSDVWAGHYRRYEK